MQTCEEKCPRCQGTMTVPYRLYTDSGWALTVNCMNCGHYVFHPEIYRDYTEKQPENKNRELLRDGKKAVCIQNGKVSRVVDLSRYDFGTD